MSQYKIEACTAHHLGDQLQQQDCVGLFSAPKAPGYMMAVLADGAGSDTDGQPAAAQVVRTARQNFEVFSPLIETVDDLLAAIASEAHTLIQLNAIAAKKEPYSTMVLLILTPERSAIWAHLGDSRLYRFRAGSMQEHTNDDAHIEKAILALRTKQAHPSALPSARLGESAHSSLMTVNRIDNCQEGDAFLLCSDGLWRFCDEVTMGEALSAPTPRQAGEQLIACARKNGQGKNAGNCTMAIVRLQPADRKSRPAMPAAR